MKMSVAIVALFATVILAQKPLEFKVIMMKDTYLVGESIDIGMSIKNTGNVANKTGLVDINMFFDGGSKLKCRVSESRNIFSPNPVVLHPNEETFKGITLDGYFATGSFNWRFRPFFKNGTYIIKVYFYDTDENKPAIIEKVIKVVEPTGDEKEVFNSFSEIVNKIPYDPKKIAVDLELLFRAHTNSSYLPMLLANLHRDYSIYCKDRENANRIADEIVEICPWSLQALRGLNETRLEKTLPNKTKRIEYIQKILPKVKNSIMQKVLEVRLKEEKTK